MVHDQMLARAMIKGFKFDGKRYPMFDIKYTPRKCCKLHQKARERLPIPSISQDLPDSEIQKEEPSAISLSPEKPEQELKPEQESKPVDDKEIKTE